jgi:hypothetical protein
MGGDIFIFNIIANHIKSCIINTTIIRSNVVIIIKINREWIIIEEKKLC